MSHIKFKWDKQASVFCNNLWYIIKLVNKISKYSNKKTDEGIKTIRNSVCYLHVYL